MSLFQEFIPKSYLYLRYHYNFETFKKDLIAGITIGIIALPLAMAFAIASGVTPDRGLFTAIIAGFLISVLGGSRVQIGGPTGAFVVIIYGIVQKTGIEGLAMSTLVAAIILLLLGLCRVGSWIKYVPHPLVTGFTTGIAVIIFSSQIKDFFGLPIATLPADFVEKWALYFTTLPKLDPVCLGLGIGTLGVILGVRRFFPKIPWGIAAIVLSTLVCSFFHLPVETIQSKFGGIPNHLPLPEWPSFSALFHHPKEILINGFAIAFLGAIESLLCCVIADGMIGSRHKSNCELVGQGIANFASVLFGGIPATGAIARTAANVKMGAQTPVAGIIHALTLLAIIVFFSPLVSKIPLAALSAVLMMVAWNMSELPHFLHYLKAPLGDAAILMTAFLLTVFVDITMAITLGMILASFIFMRRMSISTKTVALANRELEGEFPERGDPDAISKKTIPSGVEVYEIQGPLFFGATHLFQDLMAHYGASPPKIFILRMRQVPMIDASGMHALKEFFHICKGKNTKLLLSGVHGKAKFDLERSGLTNLIGKEHIFPHIDAALKKAFDLVH